jgi:O-antigen ligase
MNQLFSKALFPLFLLIIIWAPLPIASNRAWSQMLLCLLVTLLLLLWCWLFCILKVKLSQAFINAKYAIFFLVCSQTVVAYQYLCHTIDPNATLKSLLFGCTLVIYFCLALLIINNKKRLIITLYCIILSGVFQSFYGSLMTLSGLEYGFFTIKKEYLGVATGSFINRNHLAFYLIVCSSFTIGLLVAQSNQFSSSFKCFITNMANSLLNGKVSLRLAIIIMVTGMVLTHSRMGNTAFFISLSIMVFITVIIHKYSLKSIVLLFISMLIIDIAIIGSFFGVQKVIDRIEHTSSTKENRDEINLYSIKLIKENILLGTGSGTFYTSFPRVRDQETGPRFYDHAHNDYIEFLSDRGILGTLPLLFFIFISFFTACKAMLKRKQKVMKASSFGCIMSTLALAIHSTVDFNLHIPANAMLFILCAALGWIALYLTPGSTPRKHII